MPCRQLAFCRRSNPPHETKPGKELALVTIVWMDINILHFRKISKVTIDRFRYLRNLGNVQNPELYLQQYEQSLPDISFENFPNTNVVFPIACFEIHKGVAMSGTKTIL